MRPERGSSANHLESLGKLGRVGKAVSLQTVIEPDEEFQPWKYGHDHHGR
jgi:hypothetical protein